MLAYHTGRVNRWLCGVCSEDYQCIESSRWEPDWRIPDTEKRTNSPIRLEPMRGRQVFLL